MNNNDEEVTYFHLSDLPLSPNFVQALAYVLNTNSTLHQLWLDHNNIGAKGAIALAEALKDNSTLRALYIDTNQIGDQGAKTLKDNPKCYISC